MPVFSESHVAVARAKLPERSVPGRGIAGCGARTGGNQPALDDIAQKSLRDEALSFSARQFLRLKDPPPVTLQLVELRKRSGKLLVCGGHSVLRSRFNGFYKSIALCDYKYIA